MIRKLTDEKPTYGYRRVTRLLGRELKLLGKPQVNHKRVYRIMRENSLCLQPYVSKPTRTHDGKIITLKSDLRWCSDGFEIQCWNGEKVQVAFSLDCHDREVIRWLTSSRGLDGALVRDLMTESAEARFGPIAKLPHSVQWLTDNVLTAESRAIARQYASMAENVRNSLCRKKNQVVLRPIKGRPLDHSEHKVAA
jgi:transposase InsO family protein